MRSFGLAIVVATAAALHLPAAPNRRDLLRYATAGAAATAGPLSALAAGTTKPILVLGANGGTGLECVNYLLAQKRPCIAATRTGEFVGDASSSLLTVARGDVTSLADMKALIQPDMLGGVIYAASASRKSEAKKTSGSKAVDRDGLVTCAQVCIESSVPRLVLVSSGGVSKPTSAVYLFLNVAASGIMDAKIAGEDKLRAMYAAPGVAERNLGYTVVRPGGLTREAALGVGAVELNQGDDKSGRIARSDVCALSGVELGSATRALVARSRGPNSGWHARGVLRRVVSLCVSRRSLPFALRASAPPPRLIPPLRHAPPATPQPRMTGHTHTTRTRTRTHAHTHTRTHAHTHTRTHTRAHATHRITAVPVRLQCYYANTAKGLGEVFQSNSKGSTEATVYVSGKERRADTWPALFDGLERDR